SRPLLVLSPKLPPQRCNREAKRQHGPRQNLELVPLIELPIEREGKSQAREGDKSRRSGHGEHQGEGLSSVLMMDGDDISFYREELWKEENVLCEAPEENIVDSDVEDEDELQSDLQDKKSFLEVYPQVKLELEGHIRKLRALADKIDKVHRDCTITQVVAGSTSVVSGILTVLGLALAPVTAGVSLGLSATGLGLGVAAAVTSVSTSIVDKVSIVSAKAEARKLVLASKKKVKAIKKGFCKRARRLVSISTNSFQNLLVPKNIDAIKLAKASHCLANNAMRLMITGSV
ncbi:apolipoprotein L3-like, partial [Sigmodon hispidus]